MFGAYKSGELVLGLGVQLALNDNDVQYSATTHAIESARRVARMGKTNKKTAQTNQ